MGFGSSAQAPQVAVTPQQALIAWEKADKALAEAKKAEAEARKLAMTLNAPNAKEGVNNIPLANGFVLKATHKVSRKFAVPVDFGMIGDREPTVADAVDRMTEEMRRHSNEGAFVADRLVKWEAGMSEKEYKALKGPLKDIVNKYVVSSDGAPTLKIEGPKS